MIVDCCLIFTPLSMCACDLHIPTKFHSNQITSAQVWSHIISQDRGHAVTNLIPFTCSVMVLVWYISMRGCVTTSNFWKQTATVLEFYFRFTIWPHTTLWHAALFNTTKFRRRVMIHVYRKSNMASAHLGLALGYSVDKPLIKPRPGP